MDTNAIIDSWSARSSALFFITRVSQRGTTNEEQDNMSTQDMMDEQNSEFSETGHMNDDERFTSTEEELQFVKQKLEEREEQLSKAVGM